MIHKIKLGASICAIVVAIGISPTAFGATAWITSNIDRIMTTNEDELGACIFRTTKPLPGTVDCPRDWVTADCAGVLGEGKSAGSKKFDIVMLAKLTTTQVTLAINDQKKINGWCFADRVILR